MNADCSLTINLNLVHVVVWSAWIIWVVNTVVVGAVRHQKIIDNHRRPVITEAVPFAYCMICCCIDDSRKVIDSGGGCICEETNSIGCSRCVNIRHIATRQRHTLTGLNSVWDFVPVVNSLTAVKNGQKSWEPNKWHNMKFIVTIDIKHWRWCQANVSKLLQPPMTTIEDTLIEQQQLTWSTKNAMRMKRATTVSATCVHSCLRMHVCVQIMHLAASLSVTRVTM